ncbi:hypothetical protein ACWGQ4_00210 [Streptomyces sp. NPDC055721]|uniref:hypothetical protein n=1 Tax=Streptomyces sp. NPDC127132 TaxID=3345374 RepID=UPI00363D527E
MSIPSETAPAPRGQTEGVHPAATHLIVLPGGGYASHAAHEAEPIVAWLSTQGLSASVFRYPLHVRHPEPLLALRAEIRRRREEGADRIGVIGFSAGGHLAGLAAHEVPHTVHVFAHGPHSLGLAEGAGDTATCTRLAESWIAEQVRMPHPGTS